MFKLLPLDTLFFGQGGTGRTEGRGTNCAQLELPITHAAAFADELVIL